MLNCDSKRQLQIMEMHIDFISYVSEIMGSGLWDRHYTFAELH